MKNSLDEDGITWQVNLPAREFLFTLEQVAMMIDVTEDYLTKKLVHFHGRTTGRAKGLVQAVNIAPPDEEPAWRIPETEIKLWMRYRGISFVEKRNVRLK